MSNPWAQSFDELRSPYLQEKKAKKDYDGDGKVESGAKEYRGVVHNKIQKAKGGKADGQDTSSVKEHHQKDADGKVIEHEDTTPSSVEEMADKKFGPGGDPIKKPGFIDKALDKLKKNTPAKKVDKAHYEPEGEISYTAAYLPEINVDEAKIDKIDPKNKRKRRNEVSFGKQTRPYDPPTKAYKTHMSKYLQKQRKEKHDEGRGTTYKRPRMKQELSKSELRKYEEISYTAAYLPSNVDEAKIDQGMSTDQKRAARNERSGRKDKPMRGPATGKKISKRHMSKFNQERRRDDHEEKRGVKKEKGKMTLKDRAGLGRGMTRANQFKNIMNKSTSVKKDGNNIEFSHYEPQGELVNEADKKGKGSGTKDACYHKVKSRYSVWPSAYASGALVKCRKAGAKNWGNSSKKEEFDYYQMPMKSFDDLVGECWKTHERVPGTVKGAKGSCRPKGSGGTKNEERTPAANDKSFDIMRPGGANSPFDADGKPKKKPNPDSTSTKKESVKITPHDISGGTKAGKDFMSGAKNPKTGKQKYKLSNPGGMRLNLSHYDWKSDLDYVQEALKGKKLEVKETGVKNKIEINPEIKTEAAKAPVKK